MPRKKRRPKDDGAPQNHDQEQERSLKQAPMESRREEEERNGEEEERTHGKRRKRRKEKKKEKSTFPTCQVSPPKVPTWTPLTKCHVMWRSHLINFHRRFLLTRLRQLDFLIRFDFGFGSNFTHAFVIELPT